MRMFLYTSWATTLLLACAGVSRGQQTPSVQPAVNTTAAVVNGQQIPESAVQRALRRVPPARQREARAEIIKFLIDNALVDQYLTASHVDVDAKTVDAKVEELKTAIKQQGKTTLDKALQEMSLTEAELRSQIEAQLRWDKFAVAQSTEQRTQAYFAQNKEMFDGTTVRARHILLTPATNDPQAIEAAKTKLVGFKKQIEAQAAQGLEQLPPGTSEAARTAARHKLVDDAFAALAAKESACPSKQHGGDLGYFPRSGMMVEPFARAAFALQPYEMSDVVTTPFGQHLILVIDRKVGRPIKYDDVKDFVKEAYGDYLRDAVANQLRAKATIEIK